MHDMANKKGGASSYDAFLESKRHSIGDAGFEAKYIPDIAFDFQEAIIQKAVKKGRCAIFADTGLGKTLIEIAVAQNIIKKTNKRVLIMTPLAVAFQFLIEAEKIGIDDIEYSKDGKFSKKIVVCNYERLHYFNPDDFVCVIADESSILKNFEGATRGAITAFMKKIKYRFLATATPSPNDYIELGTSSEALGYLGYTDMLGRFFKNNNDNTIKSTGLKRLANAGAEWYLKPHAETAFWQWVSQWAISIRKPSDLGFSDEKFILPTLSETQYIVENKTPLVVDGQPRMFNEAAISFREIKAEVRATITQRCEKAAELADGHETSVYWVNLNDEAKLIRQIDSSATEIHGNMDLDQKEEILVAFAAGEIDKLITKPRITCFGLNWQHCNHLSWFPTYSYEQYYQLLRRFYRFGQKREVFAEAVISDGQTRIMESLQIKKQKADDMFTKLSANVNSIYSIQKQEFSTPIIKPSFLTTVR
jgi:hypothetical protein